MNEHRPQVRVISALAVLLLLPACGGGDSNGSGGPPDVLVLDEEPAPPDRSDISYVGNLIAKMDAGEWTLGEGLVATLQLFAGERDETEVLRHGELLTHEGTGIFRLANEYLQDGPDAEAQSEIARLLDLLVFSVADLESMAGLAPAAEGLAPRAGAITTKDSPELCLRFFEGFPDFPPGVGVCLEQESAMIDGKQHQVFFPARDLPSAGWNEGHVTLALQAMMDAVPVYNALGEMPAVALVFSVAEGGGLWGQSFPNPESTCGLSIYTSLQSESPEEFKQLIAHELAHCFQVQTHPAQHQAPYLVIDWHFEGAAEYWSNVVYPEVNLEWRFLERLEETELTTTIISREYENFLFFQYLGSTIGSAGILDLIGQLPSGFNTAIDQRDALASYGNMAQTYHDFAKAMTDGTITDTSGVTIPFVAQSYAVEIRRVTTPIVTAAQVVPFLTYRMLLSIDDTKQATLAFAGTGPVTESSGPATEGVSTGTSGLIVESVKRGAGRDWSRGVLDELPEEECATGRSMLIVTATEPGGAFDLNVPDVSDAFSCCLHGTWLMSTQDLQQADAVALGVNVSYSGQLSAQYRPDGTVLFLWSSFMRDYDDGATSTIDGGGSQFYSVPFDDLLVYDGPEIMPTVTESAPGHPTTTFTASLATALGDFQTSQLFECASDRLVTTIVYPQGDVDIGWSRTN